MMPLVTEGAALDGVVATCTALSMARATYYRRIKPKVADVEAEPCPSPRALLPRERQAVLDALHSERFVDQAPREVYATLLDEGRYLCSISTMYRILEANAELRERRNQLRHPNYTKPELLATRPNQVWSWDITKLRGPVKWTYYYLYVILDIFSRYVVGWMVASAESALLAQQLIGETCSKWNIQPGTLTIHADRGSSMKSKPVALLLADLGVTKTHSRPHVSDDNPYSEANFKTLKYRPEFPSSFGCIEDSRLHLRTFFGWYNDEHHHSGLGLLTPADVHFGRTAEVLAHRQTVLTAAWQANPERFVRRPPTPLQPPEKVWINPPARTMVTDDNGPSVSVSGDGELVVLAENSRSREEDRCFSGPMTGAAAGRPAQSKMALLPAGPYRSDDLVQ